MHINYDYSNFDPNAGAAPVFPVDGNYDIRLMSVEQGETKNRDPKAILTFMTLNEENKPFPMNYNIGHPNPQARQIAFEDLGRIYTGITGQTPPASGFDLSALINGVFNCDIQIKTDGQYTNCNFRNIKPVVSQEAVAAQPPAAQQPAQQQQPAVNKPAWA